MPLPQWPVFQDLARAVDPAQVAGPVLQLAVDLARVADLAQVVDQDGPAAQVRAGVQATVVVTATAVETAMVEETVTAVGQAGEMAMLVGTAISAAMAGGDDILRRLR